MPPLLSPPSLPSSRAPEPLPTFAPPWPISPCARSAQAVPDLLALPVRAPAPGLVAHIRGQSKASGPTFTAPVDDRARMRELIDLGVDAVVTNPVDLAVRIARGPRPGWTCGRVLATVAVSIRRSAGRRIVVCTWNISPLRPVT